MILFDVSHALSKASQASLGGITIVDRLYLEFFLQKNEPINFSHYSLGSPFLLSKGSINKILEKTALGPNQVEIEYKKKSFLLKWLENNASIRNNYANTILNNHQDYFRASLKRIEILSSVIANHQQSTHEPSVYLNVAQYGLEFSGLFNWLNKNTKIKPVFFLHDLLPLDHPEYFRPQTQRIFKRRLKTIKEFAAAVITSSAENHIRMQEELRSHNKKAPIIFNTPLPSQFEGVLPDPGFLKELENKNYFLIIGTIEPRKNHLLLFDIWRQLIKKMKNPPKLICIGAPGWSNNATLRSLSAESSLSKHIMWLHNLAPEYLSALIINARALLAPSFTEGFGLPLREAEALNTRVICSDIEVFHEIMRERATYISPADGRNWLKEIEALSEDNIQQPKTHYKNETSNTKGLYFKKIEEFISTI